MLKKLFALLFALFLFPLPFSSCQSEKKNSSYRLTCEYSPSEGELSGKMEFTFVNDFKETDTLCFQLYPNAYREGATFAPVSPIHRSAYYAGNSYGDITVQKVENCRSFEVGGTDKNLLFVTLNEPLSLGREITLSFTFLTRLAKVNHRLGVSEVAVNLANFYPVLCGYQAGGDFYECVYYSDGDPFYSKAANYEVSLSLPEGVTLATAGKILSQTKRDGKLLVQISAENAREFACAFSEKYKISEKSVGDITLSYYSYLSGENVSAEENSNVANEILTLAEQAITFFSKTFGAYPYSTFSLAETGFCYAGMEYPSLVYLSSSLDGELKKHTLVHETAHQWWYGGVGNNEQEYAWLDEGLSEYATALFFDAHEEYGVSKAELISSAKKAFHSFSGVFRGLFGEVDTSMNRPLSSFLSEYEYTNIAYNKGLLLFACLEDAIGQKRVLESLKKYYQENLYGEGTPERLVSCFPKEAKGIFTSFLEGTALL